MLIALLLLGAAAAAAGLLALALHQSREHEAEYRELIEHLPQTSVALFDQELRLRRLAGDALERLGLSEPDVRGRRLEEVLAPEQVEVLVDHCRAALRGELRSFEYRSRPDGRDFWVRVLPFSRGSRITGGVVLSQEITDRRDAERRSVAAEGEREQVIESMNEAYVAIDEQGLVCVWNASAERTFGYPRSGAIGRPAAELIIPDVDRAQYERLMDRYMTPGPTRREGPLALRADRLARDSSGREFMVELAAFTVDYEGRRTYHSLMHDISDRVEGERQARSHAADVEGLAESIREMARSTRGEEARASICRAAVRIVGPDVAILYEPAADGGEGLRATASEGAEVAGVVLPSSQPSAALRAFNSAKPLFVPELATDPEVFRAVVEATGATSAYFVPVMREDTPVGVLAFAWRQPIEGVGDRAVSMAEVIAAEAAVAIERAALLDRFARIARTDELTGLPNRRSWDEELPRELARARRHATPLVVAMLDLDHFKAYNDRLGHQAGDLLLEQAARAWRGVLRETDILARYGGEEFAVALPNCSPGEAAELIERIRAQTPAAVSCSGGIASWRAGESSAQLVGRADVALYEAKQAGRDRTVAA